MKKIVKFLDVIYYNLYLFFYDKTKHSNPQISACGVILFCFKFIICGVISIYDVLIKDLHFNSSYNLLILILILILIWLLLCQRYVKKDKYISIIRKKPIIKSKRFSKIITIVFIILSILPLFVLLPIVSLFR